MFLFISKCKQNDEIIYSLSTFSLKVVLMSVSTYQLKTYENTNGFKVDCLSLNKILCIFILLLKLGDAVQKRVIFLMILCKKYRN